MKDTTKTDIIFYSLMVVIYASWVCFLYWYTGRMEFGHFIFAVFGLIVTLLMIAAIMEIIRRVKNGVDLFATLESDPEKVKEHMLFVMQYGHFHGIKGALNEFNDIFRNYPELRLHEWEVFKAWYKNFIDHALEYPSIYIMKMVDGSEYSINKDPLYDPMAPSWEQFDLKNKYDDRYYKDEDLPESRSLRKDAEEGFYFGAGFGAGDSLFNN